MLKRINQGQMKSILKQNKSVFNLRIKTISTATQTTTTTTKVTKKTIGTHGNSSTKIKTKATRE